VQNIVWWVLLSELNSDNHSMHGGARAASYNRAWFVVGSVGFIVRLCVIIIITIRWFAV
jgi:hypothetical protein